MSNTSRRRFLTQAAASGIAVAGISRVATATPEMQIQALNTGTETVPDQRRGDTPDFIAPNYDMHTHTKYSDGAHDLDLHIYLAQASGLDAVAVTDHCFPDQFLGRPDVFDAYIKHIQRLRECTTEMQVQASKTGVVPDQGRQDDLLILKGAEATVIDTTGIPTLTAKQAEQLDWVLCDLGGYSEGTLRNTPSNKQTYIENVIRTYMGMCDVAHIDAIAHPFNTGNTAPAAMPDDYPRPLLRELAEKMIDKNKVFNVINGHVYWFIKSGVAARDATDQYIELVKVFADAGVTFDVSSDDHRSGVGNIAWPCEVLRRAGVKTHQLVVPTVRTPVGS